MISKINNLFLFNGTIQILIATSISVFGEEGTWLETFKFTVAHYYGVALIYLILAYVFFQFVQEDLNNKDHIKRRFARMLIYDLVLAVAMFFGVMFSSYANGFVVILVPFAMTFTIVVNFFLMWDGIMLLLGPKVKKLLRIN